MLGKLAPRRLTRPTASLVGSDEQRVDIGGTMTNLLEFGVDETNCWAFGFGDESSTGFWILPRSGQEWPDGFAGLMAPRAAVGAVADHTSRCGSTRRPRRVPIGCSCSPRQYEAPQDQIRRPRKGKARLDEDEAAGSGACEPGNP
jgi:hypothetical protein